MCHSDVIGPSRCSVSKKLLPHRVTGGGLNGTEYKSDILLISNTAVQAEMPPNFCCCDTEGMHSLGKKKKKKFCTLTYRTLCIFKCIKLVNIKLKVDIELDAL